MDALSLGTYYLTKRLNLGKPPGTIKSEIEKLFSLAGGQSPLHNLILRFNHTKHLTPTLGTWLHGEELAPLSCEDVIALFDADSIEKMAVRLEISPSELTTAFSEMIPAVIKRASFNGELKNDTTPKITNA